MTKNINKVKYYLKAKTEDDLVRKQLINNHVNDTMFDYHVIWNGKEYVAWYNVDITKIKGLNIATQG